MKQEKKMDNKKTNTIIIFFILGIFLGGLLVFSFSFDSEKEPYEIKYEGCWADVKETIKNNQNEVVGVRSNGDWVCVNIDNMKYERAVEVCKHEVGHEIFAEICEKNMSKCLEIMK
jgi:hypothetical protein